MERISKRGDAFVNPFLEAAERAPDAVWARSTGATWTRGASAGRIRACARALRERALPDASLVALVLTPTPAAVEALAAVWLAELVPVLIDASVPTGGELEIGRRLGARLAWRADGEPRSITCDEPRRLEGAGAIKLTSGSTGAPQGVVVSSAALMADTAALMRCMQLGSEDRGLVLVPLSHSYGFSVLTLPSLAHGLGLVFPEDRNVLTAAREQEATFLPSVPAWFQSVLRGGDAEPLAPSLRLLVSAGAPLQADVARGFRERFGRAIHVLYGASECGSIAFDRTGTAAERGRVGTLLDGVAVELEAAARATGGAGLVCVRSPACGDGYLPEREGGAARLAAGRYRSEDLAAWVDGELELRGRTSAWIDVKGRKVDPRDVEAALAGHPSILDVAVLGKPLANGSGESVRAVIACAPGALSYLDVIAWCRPRLAAYQLPRSVVFVASLPRTERGKLDRTRLLAL